MEGPSLVILKEEAKKFIGKPIIDAWGSNKMDKERIKGQKIKDLKTWGKHFLIVLQDCTIRIHYLMFGNYYIDKKHPEKEPKLSMSFSNGEWNNYNCAAKIIEETDMNKLYNFTTDVMNDSWDAAAAKRVLKKLPNMLVCDALLDQNIFTGVGNIMKNEVLHRIYVHPESEVGALPPKKLNELVAEARNYSFDFLDWKKAGVLRKHWQAHTKKICPRCDIPYVKKHTGLNPRRSFFCTNCQVLYKMEE